MAGREREEEKATNNRKDKRGVGTDSDQLKVIPFGVRLPRTCGWRVVSRHVSGKMGLHGVGGDGPTRVVAATIGWGDVVCCFGCHWSPMGHDEPLPDLIFYFRAMRRIVRW
ncbi:hypothetical protein QQP08_006175 [Theobroma cacao]|nr:hypothetical protein QQP08_006175 [Theobroma cacao]